MRPASVRFDLGITEFHLGSNFGYTREMVMNFCDKNMSTPLHVAVSNGDVEVSVFLLVAFSKPNLIGQNYFAVF